MAECSTAAPPRNKLKISEEAEASARRSDFRRQLSFGVTISGLKQDASKLLELAADSILHPSFPEAELDQLKEDTLQRIAQEDESLLR